jgi:hypothetical protein
MISLSIACPWVFAWGGRGEGVVRPPDAAGLWLLFHFDLILILEFSF